jgi:hypothetical protein
MKMPVDHDLADIRRRLAAKHGAAGICFVRLDRRARGG